MGHSKLNETIFGNEKNEIPFLESLLNLNTVRLHVNIVILRYLWKTAPCASIVFSVITTIGHGIFIGVVEIIVEFSFLAYLDVCQNEKYDPVCTVVIITSLRYL